MAKNDRNKNGGERKIPFELRLSRDDIPQPKGKFRNMFEINGMIPESLKSKPDAGQKPDAPKSE